MHNSTRAQQLKRKDEQAAELPVLGHPQSVRDTIEQILNLSSHTASLVSSGMTYAWPYASVP